LTELIKIIAELIPMLHPDEAAKIQSRIEKLKEKRDVDYRKALEKLANIAAPGAIAALNALFAELHDSL